MEDLQEQVDRYVTTSQKIIDTLNRYSSLSVSGNGSSNVNINAGGPALWIAVWVCTICCILSLYIAWDSRQSEIKQAVAMAEQSRRLDNANDKLSIILQWAPKLAKEVDAEMDRKKGNTSPGSSKP
jgi:hypothetical protein